MEKYLAHIAEDGREQTVAEHLEGAAKLAAGFAAAFGAEDWGRLCGMAHDLGKYSGPFQRRIRGDNIRTDHSTKGCQVLLQQGAFPAAFCVAGHHGGLPDGGNPRNDDEGMPTLFGRNKKQVPAKDEWKGEVNLSKTPALTARSDIAAAFFTRMLFSCLVDADYLDTETFMAGKQLRNSGYPTIPQLLKRLEGYLDEKGFLRPKNELNERRAQVLRACLDGDKQAPGLFSLTVPTGGGKTVASLAFALSHAAKHKMDRVIYVIPYCSIIDQTARVFKDILGDDCVLEHHSGAQYEQDADGYLTAEGSKRLLATENWDMPVVVTTSVQFFESLYSARTSKCRKLHNIANSVVIFDEAQTLPIPCLRPCVSAIGELAANYRATAVLCTATQPALDKLFEELAPGLSRRELCPDVEGLFQALRRTTIVREGLLGNEELARRLQSHEQVLCIVNSRKQAQEVFAHLRGEGNVHLSTLMHPGHRMGLIKNIRDRLENGQPCRVVSTSLIEAGVDLDFPAVYRAEAGLDSILQAAGRCNRENKNPAGESIVTVFQSEQPAPRVFSANIGAYKETAALHGDVGDPAAVSTYFNALLSLKGDALDKYEVLRGFAQGLGGAIYPFRTIGDRFRMIDTTAKTMYIPCDENADLIKRLRAGDVDRGLFRKLGGYGVTVYPQHFDALEAAGDIEKIDEDSAILLNKCLYSDMMGLSLEAEEGKGIIL